MREVQNRTEYSKENATERKKYNLNTKIKAVKTSPVPLMWLHYDDNTVLRGLDS